MSKLIVLAAAGVLCLSTACTTTSVSPPQPHLAGEWHLDEAASDDPDIKIAAAVDLAESKLRKRLVGAGFDQYDSGSAAPGTGHHRHGNGGSASDASSSGAALNGDEFSATGFIGPDFADLRARLKRVLYPPRLLMIDVTPDSVRLAGDNIPPRDYPAGDDFTRIDEYGTAKMDTRWSGNTFELRAKYGSHSSVIEHYLADEPAGTLSVTRNVVDPVAGKIATRTIYRR